MGKSKPVPIRFSLDALETKEAKTVPNLEIS